METQNLFLKDEDGEEVDVHLYRSVIGSLMYLTSSRPDIMFAVCACARYQVKPKVSHLYAVKRIFRYLKGQPKLGLWYPKDSPFDLVAYTDSDYAGASLDTKSTTGGCQFLGSRLISWQCKKQTVVANSITEVEYVAASSCCGQVFWIQNQLLYYGDSNEKKLIHMVKIHSDKNVADLLTKAFDPIKYALTINPTIYTLCIEKFWATVKVKTVNGEVQLQALMDGKKIIVTKVSVRRDLQLNDKEGTNCLQNITIFEELTRMAYAKLSHKLTFYKAFFSPQWKFLIHTILQCLSAKTTACNEFSSTMAYVIICLATNQKFNFSKYIFESMVKNLDNAGKFLMYPRSRRPKRKDTEVPQPSGPTTNVVDEAINEEMDDSLERAATTATGLDADHDSAEPEVTIKDVNLSVDEVTLAQALAALKSAKVKAQDNGKRIMVEELMKIKKKKQISLDEELAFKLQAEEEEEERLNREKAQREEEANIVHRIMCKQ
ncbi:hypothetical protein Tco_1280879 [Tanacetum coccineum]